MNSASPKLPHKSISALTILNLSSAVVGFVQTILIAWYFGTTRAAEVFFAATTFQELLLQLTSSGQIGDLFTPIYHQIRQAYGVEQAREAFSVMITVMALAAAAIAAPAMLLAEPISRLIVPGFSPDEIALTARVFLILAPIIVVLICSAMYSNYLRAEHYYGVAECLALASRIVNLLILVCFAEALGVWALVLGLWNSAAIHLVGQAWYAHATGYRFRPRWRTESFRPRNVLFKIPFAYSHIVFAQLFVVALTANLTKLPEGSYAAYGYAKRLHSKFQGMILQPIGIVFFNHLSHSLAQGAVAVRSYAEHALRLTLTATMYCFVPIVAAGDYLLSGLWGGQKFPPEMIQTAYVVLCALTALLALDAQYLIGRRTNLALQLVGRQFAASGTVLLLCAALSYLLVPRFGVEGAVAVQFISVLGTTLTTLAILAHRRRDLVCVMPAAGLACWLAAAGGALAVTWAVRITLLPDVGGPRRISLIVGVGLSVLSIASLTLFAIAFRIPEVQELMGKVRYKVRHFRGAGANT